MEEDDLFIIDLTSLSLVFCNSLGGSIFSNHLKWIWKLEVLGVIYGAVTSLFILGNCFPYKMSLNFGSSPRMEKQFEGKEKL